MNLMCFYLIFLLPFILKVVYAVETPYNLTSTVGGNATFLWNTTASIDEIKWGLYNGLSNKVLPYFLLVDIFTKGVQKSNALNTDPIASRYKNRVHFIGNITKGKGWFVITDLTQNDTRKYAARIKEEKQNFKLFQVMLTVVPLPTKAAPSSISTTKTPVTTTTTQKQTSTTEPPTTEKQGLSDGAKAGIGIGVAVFISGLVVVGFFVVKKKKDGRGKFHGIQMG